MMEWRKVPLSFVGVVDALFVGKWRVGHVTDSFTYPNPPDGKFTFYCHLPGVPCASQTYADAPQAQKALEYVVKNWIEQSGLGS
ncbi:hypothetical protein AXL65_02550 [Salmonella enterica subsp. enterica]|nr:hypothetical protein [Salmonella enterica subsp. enterica]